MDDMERSENRMTCNEEMKSYLLETAKWGKFLAIMGYISLAILALMGILMGLGMQALSTAFPYAWARGFFGLFYIIMAALYFFPTTYLYRFSVRSKEAAESDNEEILTEAFLNLKKVFKFIGILTIVLLSLYALMFVIGLPILIMSKAF